MHICQKLNQELLKVESIRQELTALALEVSKTENLAELEKFKTKLETKKTEFIEQKKVLEMFHN